MLKKVYSKEDAISLLKNKSEELLRAGEQRFPRRSDFCEEEINAIKSYLGPWPRALEAAALKPPRSPLYAQKQLEKRIRSKQKRTADKIQKRNAGSISFKTHEGEKT